mmetsp:Transcript_7032/g.43192  ORF Transcript_7032/g.43192 Transcript_7032/m.43192 type:complete len:362 (-) Transcript_7032:16-1101(-)
MFYVRVPYTHTWLCLPNPEHVPRKAETVLDFCSTKVHQLKERFLGQGLFFSTLLCSFGFPSHGPFSSPPSSFRRFLLLSIDSDQSHFQQTIWWVHHHVFFLDVQGHDDFFGEGYERSGSSFRQLRVGCFAHAFHEGLCQFHRDCVVRACSIDESRDFTYVSVRAGLWSLFLALPVYRPLFSDGTFVRFLRLFSIRGAFGRVRMHERSFVRELDPFVHVHADQLILVHFFFVFQRRPLFGLGQQDSSHQRFCVLSGGHFAHFHDEHVLGQLHAAFQPHFHRRFMARCADPPPSRRGQSHVRQGRPGTHAHCTFQAVRTGKRSNLHQCVLPRPKNAETCRESAQNRHESSKRAPCAPDEATSS